jgi:AraC-like DNA-binding protein
MKPVVQVLSLIPSAFLDRPHVVTRYLYLDRKPGRLTCVFQRHPLEVVRPMHLQAYPARLEANRQFKRQEDTRIFAVSYVLAGTADLTYADESAPHRLRPGDIFQYNAQTTADLDLQPHPGFAECSISVDGATGRGLLDLEIWDSSLRVAHPGLHASVARAYLDLYGAIPDHTRAARGLLGQLAGLLDYVYSLVGRESDDERFKARACGLLAANVSPQYTMQQAAQAVGMTYDTFRRAFRTVVGMAPIEYQVRRRMEQACMLLERHTVKQTAQLLDYTDPFVFSRQFKKYTGSAPATYRRA